MKRALIFYLTEENGPMPEAKLSRVIKRKLRTGDYAELSNPAGHHIGEKLVAILAMPEDLFERPATRKET